MTTRRTPTFDARAALTTERDALRSKLSEVGFGGGRDSNYDQNFADTSQVTAEKGEAEVLSAALSEALGDVEKALAKIDTDQYGICERCGLTIPEARLEAVPTASLCISCASMRQ